MNADPNPDQIVDGTVHSLKLTRFKSYYQQRGARLLLSVLQPNALKSLWFFEDLKTPFVTPEK